MDSVSRLPEFGPDYLGQFIEFQFYNQYGFSMRTISIQDLKQRLSEVIAAAEAGERFVITRHRKPVAELGSTEFGRLHVGAQFGAGRLSTVLEGPTDGRYLEVLRDDRAGDE